MSSPSPSPRPASPRLVFPLAPCVLPCPAPSARRLLSAGPHLTRLPSRASPKGGPAGPMPPSLLRHPNLDACLPCLCRIPITDRPMHLANHGPCLSPADASPEYQVSPVLSLILILLMLLCSFAARWVLGAGCWPTMPWLPPLVHVYGWLDISSLRPPIVSFVPQ